MPVLLNSQRADRLSSGKESDVKSLIEGPPFGGTLEGLETREADCSVSRMTLIGVADRARGTLPRTTE